MPRASTPIYTFSDRKRHNLEPGSAEWLAHRAEQYNAGDAAAMLGCGHDSRTDLLDKLLMGFDKDVSWFQQQVFDRGHAVEAAARPIAEQILGEDLYPLVYSCAIVHAASGDRFLMRRLGASVDGAPLAGELHWECKSLNDELRSALPYKGLADIANNDARRLPKKYRVQMTQQAIVRGSRAVLFSAAAVDAEGNVIEHRHCYYEPEPELADELIRGWAQFEADLAEHKPVVHAERAKGEKQEALGALVVRVMGSVVESNLPQWKELAFARIAALNMELKTDEHFGQAELDVKWCEESERTIKQLKRDVIAQMASVDDVVTTLDAIVERMAAARKQLTNKVAERKIEIRTEVCNQYERQAGEHRNKMVERIRALDVTPQPHLLVPELGHKNVAANFPGAIKSLKTVKSLHNAASTHLSQVKIALSSVTDTIETNLRHFKAECADWRHLFTAREMPDLVLKPAEDFQALCTARIGEAQRAEAERKAREQAEQQARAEAEERRRQEEAQRAQQHVGTVAGVPATGGTGGAGGALVEERVQFTTTVTPLRRTADPFSFPSQPGDHARAQADAGEAPARRGPPTLKLGTINAELGFTCTQAFMEAIGFPGERGERNAILYHVSDWPAICQAIAEHCQRKAELDDPFPQQAA